MATYKIYKGHNSPFVVDIFGVTGQKYSSAQMATITRAYLKYIPTSGATPEFADSVATPEVFDWATYATTGRIIVDAGMLPLTAGRDTKAELVVYDSEYTEGRVITQLNLTVSEEAYDGTPILQSLSLPKTVTDDYQVLVADFMRPSIRVNAATLKTVTLPAMTSAYDGAQVSVIILGDGDVDIVGSGTDTIINETHTKVTGTQKYSSIKLEYIHAITAWVVKKTIGSWTGGTA